ncbi:MAG: two-component system response regulator, partial [Spirochaetales bacterium]|nr:two-component system response regulator [Spirochaetales bacterium]
GYPYGKGEEEIPLSARLMAVADVYDALVSKRVYKEKIPEKETVEILVEGRGKHFDPMLIDAFLRCRTDFSRIHREFREPLAHGV